MCSITLRKMLVILPFYSYSLAPNQKQKTKNKKICPISRIGWSLRPISNGDDTTIRAHRSKEKM